MNFPGLDPAWKGFHGLLRASGVIRPWDLDECRRALEMGDGVLVVASTALGDSILCTPLLQSMSAAIGAGRVAFLVKEPYAGLYEGSPYAGHVCTVRGKYRGLLGLRESLCERRFRVALVANMTEPDLVPWLWHCGIRGFLRYKSRWSQWPGWFANADMMKKPGEEGYATGHAIDNNLAMANALGIEPAQKKLLITADCPESVTLATGSYFMLHAGASRPRKRWPTERWSELVRRLQAQSGKVCVLTGDGREAEEAEKISRGSTGKTINLAGKLSLRELAAWQRRAALFISGDTGPYHLAVAVGCPTVTLFAPTDRGSSTEACGPKYADPLRHRALEISSYEADIKEIEVDSVLRESEAILSQP